MIESLEELLDNSPASGPDLSMGTSPEECYLVNGPYPEPEEVSPGLAEWLKRQGILYLYGGRLAFNSMALNVLREMRGGGDPLEEEGFRASVDASKRHFLRVQSRVWPAP